MAKISNTLSYPNQSPIEGADYLIGTAANSTPIDKQTKTFTIQGIADYVIDSAFNGVSYRLPIFTASSVDQESVLLVNSLLYQDTAAPAGEKAEVVLGSTVYLDNGAGVGNLIVAQQITGNDVTAVADVNVGAALTMGTQTYFNQSVVYDANDVPGTGEQVLVSQPNGTVEWQNYQGSGLEFQGSWDARTAAEGGALGDGGNPNLLNVPLDPANTGKYWIVTADGSVALTTQGGATITDWKVGDWAIVSEDLNNNIFWDKIDNSSVLTGGGTTGNIAIWTSPNELGDAPIVIDPIPGGTSMAFNETATHTITGTAGSNAFGSDQLITADLAISGGEDNENAGQSSIVVGSNIVNNAAELAAFGKTHNISSQSTHSLVAGAANTVDGSKNVVGGKDHTITADTSAVFGFTNDVSGLGHLVSGSGNQVSGELGFFGGLDNTCSTDFSIIAGEGNSVTADHGTAFGKNNSVTGQYSTAMGVDTIASGITSFAAGFTALASGGNSVAMGSNPIASNTGAVALGVTVTASGEKSFASGLDTVASGLASTAMGNDSEASGINSFAAGKANIASGNQSTAFGQGSESSGNFSISWGEGSQAIGDYSTAGGDSCEAKGNKSVALGDQTLTEKDGGISLGTKTQSLDNYDVAIGDGAIAQGENSVSIGKDTNATGFKSMALVDSSVASGETSLAAGKAAAASGDASVAIGNAAASSGVSAIALGQEAEAQGEGSAALGFKAFAVGRNSVALGPESLANGEGSIAMGQGSSANGKYSVAIGSENDIVEDGGQGNVAIGNNNKVNDIAAAQPGDGNFALGNSNTITGSVGAVGEGNEWLITAGSVGRKALVLGNDNKPANAASGRVGAIVLGNSLNNFAQDNAIYIGGANRTSFYSNQKPGPTNLSKEIVRMVGSAVRIGTGLVVADRVDIGSNVPAGSMIVGPYASNQSIDSNSVGCAVIGIRNEIINGTGSAILGVDNSADFTNSTDTSRSHIIGFQNNMENCYSSFIVGGQNEIQTNNNGFALGFSHILKGQDSMFAFGENNTGPSGVNDRNSFMIGGQLTGSDKTMNLGFRNDVAAYPANNRNVGLGDVTFTVSTGLNTNVNSNALLITEGGINGGNPSVPQVPRIILPTVPSFEASDDAAADARGIPKGGLYHDNGVVRVNRGTGSTSGSAPLVSFNGTFVNFGASGGGADILGGSSVDWGVEQNTASDHFPFLIVPGPFKIIGVGCQWGSNLDYQVANGSSTVSFTISFAPLGSVMTDPASWTSIGTITTQWDGTSGASPGFYETVNLPASGNLQGLVVQITAVASSGFANTGEEVEANLLFEKV